MFDLDKVLVSVHCVYTSLSKSDAKNNNTTISEYMVIFHLSVYDPLLFLDS